MMHADIPTENEVLGHRPIDRVDGKEPSAARRQRRVLGLQRKREVNDFGIFVKGYLQLSVSWVSWWPSCATLRVFIDCMGPLELFDAALRRSPLFRSTFETDHQSIRKRQLRKDRSKNDQIGGQSRSGDSLGALFYSSSPPILAEVESSSGFPDVVAAHLNLGCKLMETALATLAFAMERADWRSVIRWSWRLKTFRQQNEWHSGIEQDQINHLISTLMLKIEDEVIPNSHPFMKFILIKQLFTCGYFIQTSSPRLDEVHEKRCLPSLIQSLGQCGQLFGRFCLIPQNTNCAMSSQSTIQQPTWCCKSTRCPKLRCPKLRHSIHHEVIKFGFTFGLRDFLFLYLRSWNLGLSYEEVNEFGLLLKFCNTKGEVPTSDDLIYRDVIIGRLGCGYGLMKSLISGFRILKFQTSRVNPTSTSTALSCSLPSNDDHKNSTSAISCTLSDDTKRNDDILDEMMYLPIDQLWTKLNDQFATLGTLQFLPGVSAVEYLSPPVCLPPQHRLKNLHLWTCSQKTFR